MDEHKIKALKSEFQQEYPEFMTFVTTSGPRLLTSILLILAVFMGIRFYFSHKHSSIEKAAMAMAQAKSLDALERVAIDYKSTPSAPLAYMSLGKAYFQSGDYDMALNKYLEFESKFPNHPLLLAVQLNRINCLEARGQVQEAKAEYEKFAKEHPEHFLATEALFGQARCLAQLGEWEKAKVIYEDYMVANPKGTWFPRAEDALSEVDRHLSPKVAESKED